MALAEHHEHRHSLVTKEAHLSPEQTRDPVCGVAVDPAATKYRAEHRGVTYSFCSAKCQEKFIAEPNKYLKPSKPVLEPRAPKGVIYTCPMHPQIRRTEPGNCPICGMTLEPVSASETSGPSPELIGMTRRFWIGTALAVPLVVLEMGAHFPGLNLHRYVSPQISVWVRFLLATPVVLWAGWPFFVRGAASVSNRSLRADSGHLEA